MANRRRGKDEGQVGACWLPLSDDFTRRRRAREKLKSAIPGAKPAVYRAALSKGQRFRLYRIDPIPGGWRCEVWTGRRIHRTQDVPTRTHMIALKNEFEFEVAELLLDGWTVNT